MTKIIISWCGCIWATVCLLSCGAVATLPQDHDSLDLSQILSQSVWSSENQALDHAVHVSSAYAIDNIPNNSIVYNPYIESSSMISGTFFVSVPDAESVFFETMVGVVGSDHPELIFEIYCQLGSEFKHMAHVSVVAENQLIPMVVDLSPYRNRRIFLTLSVKPVSPELGLLSPVFWAGPRIVITS